MSSESDPTSTALPAPRRVRRLPLFFVSVLLLIEFLDELLDGVGGAAWPLIRDDLRLSYTEVGILLSVPALISTFIEPALGILADVWRRRVIILAGGVAFTFAVLAVAASYNFAALLAAYIVFYPAGGAFVALSQATLMDAEPARREQNMARWTLAGSLGNAAGPLLVGAALAYGVGWRALFVGLAALSAVALGFAWRLPFPTPGAGAGRGAGPGFLDGAREAWRALRRREVVRWLVLLKSSDFMWDVLRGFLALYFVDVVGSSEGEAALALVVLTCVGLPGDFLLLPLLERVNGMRYLRWSVAGVLVLFPLFLLAEGLTLKLVLLGALGFVNTGWYSILQARLYAEVPGRSGSVLVLDNTAGLVASPVPLLLGAFAERFGLEAMMWLLALGPLVLLAGLLTAPESGREDGERKGGVIG